MIRLTSERVESLIASAKTEKDLVALLRSHKIKYSFTTDTGTLTIRIPCKKGYIRIHKTRSASRPFTAAPVPPSPWNCTAPRLHAED